MDIDFIDAVNGTKKVISFDKKGFYQKILLKIKVYVQLVMETNVNQELPQVSVLAVLEKDL